MPVLRPYHRYLPWSRRERAQLPACCTPLLRHALLRASALYALRAAALARVSVLRCVATTAAKVAHPAGPECKRAAETFPGHRPASTWCSKTAAKVGQPAVTTDNTGGSSCVASLSGLCDVSSSINSNLEFSLSYI